MGRLQTVTVTELNGQSVDDVTTYAYDLDGNLHSTATATGSATLTATNAYDDLNRLKALVNAGTSENVISSYSYTRNAVGDITQVIEREPDGTSRTENYTYDVLDRLTEETVTVGGVVTSDTTYVYDLVGNRWSQTDASGTTNFNYNSDDQLYAQSDPSGVATDYLYDANGSLTQTTVNGTITASYTYDDRNRLISATVNGTTKNYTYDDDGNRVSSTTAAGTTVYEFDEQSPTGYTQVLAEKSGATSAIQAAYAYGLQLIAQARPATGTSLYLYDGHGSVRALASTSGTVTDTYTYDAFGNLTSPTGSTPNVYLYSGQRFDSVLGEYDLRARDYDPTTGQFTSMDSRVAGPGDLGNANLYAYVGGNPLNLQDPSGHEESAIGQVAALGIALNLTNLIFDAFRFSRNPSATNGAWVAVDIVGLIVPFSGPGLSGGRATVSVIGTFSRDGALLSNLIASGGIVHFAMSASGPGGGGSFGSSSGSGSTGSPGGSPEVNNLLHDVASSPGSAADKVKLLIEGAAKLPAGTTFDRDLSFGGDGIQAVFLGKPLGGAQGGRAPVAVVLSDERILKGLTYLGPSGNYGLNLRTLGEVH